MTTSLERQILDRSRECQRFEAPGAELESFSNMPAEETGVYDKVLAKLEALARRCASLASSSIPLPSMPGRALPRYIFTGPSGGSDPIRIGLFAGIHGDEPAGCEAVAALCERLIQRPALAENYELYFYPLCNRHGLETGTRYSRSGRDLNREFWKDSTEPEVRALEEEILTHRFSGFLSLHSDDTSPGMYGFVRGAVLAKSLLAPALIEAEEFLPRNRESVIDGFPAENGIISCCYDGVLTAPPKLAGTPFEIILETPHGASPHLQVQALVAAMERILAEYRKFIAFAADL